MQTLGLMVVLATQLLCCALGVAGCVRKSSSQASNQEAVLAALVALHAGDDCTSPRPQGAHQLAVIEEAVRVVNTHGGVPIGLRVYDTCSSPEGAVKATLKALVAAEEDTCLQPPFFLGFVGPDDPASVEAVSRVVHVFNLTHVAPWRMSRPPWLKDHTLHVANTHHERTAQAVLTTMRQAGWTSFLAAHSASDDAAHKTKVLLQMASGSDVCVLSPPIQLPADQLIYALQQEGPKPSGAVLVVDSWAAALQLLSRLPATMSDSQVLVVSGDTELPTHLPAVNLTVALLLETAAVQLAPTFREHITSVTKVVEDVWSAPLAHAVRLYGAALLAAQTLKCPDLLRSSEPCLGAEEWHAMMAGASVQADDVSPDLISFSAELPTSHRLYLAEKGASPRWVGNITDGGKKLHLASNWSLPAPPSAATCTNNVEKVAVQTPSAGNLWPDMVHGHGFYEAVGMMAGAATGLLGLLILCTWVVYRSFRVPGKRRSPPSSVSSFSHMS